MTDVNLALQAVVDAIAAKAATAAPNDLAYLGKALEAVAPGSQTSLIVQIGGAQVEAVETAGAAQVAAVNQAGTAKTSEVNTAGDAKVAAVTSAGDAKVSEINAAVIGGAATLAQFTASVLTVSLPSSVRPTVYVKADPILAMTQVTLRLSDATTVALSEIEIRNTSWAVIKVTDNTGAYALGFIPPQSKRIVRATHPWASGWTLEAISPPMLMPDYRAVIVQASTQYVLALPGDWGSTTEGSNPAYSLGGNTYYCGQTSYMQPYGLSLVCDSGGSPLALAALRLFYNSTAANSFLGWTKKDIVNSNSNQFQPLGSSPNGYDTNSLGASYNASSLSYQARSHGWKTLAVAAMYHQSMPAGAGVNLYIADFAANRNTAVRVAGVVPTSEIALVPFMDDRTFVVIVPTSGGRSVYRYVVDASGNITAKGTMSFSTNASFVKLSVNRLLVIDGGASGVYSMDDSGSTMTLTHSLPAAVYNLCAVNGAIGAHLVERVAVLGNGTFFLENNGTVSGRTNNYAGFGSNNRMHAGAGVFINQDQNLGHSPGSVSLHYFGGWTGRLTTVSSQHGLAMRDGSVQFYFTGHSEGVAMLAYASSSLMDTVIGASGSKRWDMSLNCLVKDQ